MSSGLRWHSKLSSRNTFNGSPSIHVVTLQIQLRKRFVWGGRTSIACWSKSGPPTRFVRRSRMMQGRDRMIGEFLHRGCCRY